MVSSSLLSRVDRRLVLVVALAILAVGAALYLGAGDGSGPALGATMVEYAL